MARIFHDRHDTGDDLRRILDMFGEGAGATGECAPPCDVVETDAALELVIDVPGVPPESLKVVLAQNTLLVAGEKRPAACEHRQAAFHLAERAFGHFARAVHLTGAFDAGRASARLAAGELRIVLPRIEDRRGGEIRIPVLAD